MSQSFWDRYLAPGDLRRQHHPLQPLSNTSQNGVSKQEAAVPTIVPHRIDAAHRARRQNTLLIAGLTFTCLSLLITRRALTRKLTVLQPAPVKPTPPNPLPGISTSTPTAPKPDVNTASRVDGGLEAVEALALASLNVFSIALAAVGVGMKYFDIADVEDLRDKVRRGVGFDVYGGDSEADRELEGWVAEVLSRKEEGGGVGGLQESLARKLGELEGWDTQRREGERREEVKKDTEGRR